MLKLLCGWTPWSLRASKASEHILGSVRRRSEGGPQQGAARAHPVRRHLPAQARRRVLPERLASASSAAAASAAGATDPCQPAAAARGDAGYVVPSNVVLMPIDATLRSFLPQWQNLLALSQLCSTQVQPSGVLPLTADGDRTRDDAHQQRVEGAGREAKCPYVLLLRRHCPLPALLLLRPPASSTAANEAINEPAVLTADEPRLTGASAKSMDLDLDLDYQFDSPTPSPVREVGRAGDAAQSASMGGVWPTLSGSAVHGGSKTANDPVRPQRAFTLAYKLIHAGI